MWDWPTRLAHWLFVALVFTSWRTAEEHMMDWHMRSGLGLLGVLVFRIYWGFAGPRTARFAGFIKGPRSVLAYGRTLMSGTHKLAFGHNPLGALSVVAILLALAAQVGLGLFAMDTDGLSSGPLARFISYELAEEITDLHEDAFNVLVVLIGVHVAAVLFYLIAKRANLTGPMITGRRRLTDAVEPSPRPMARAPFTRLLLGVAISILAVWLVTR